ncbi:nucleotidyltransferase domain-containing protein [Candidatus Peregrinibacteria bacterium]|nr:MAG: nucleotidyltransferase domain-containing protein [Candidatus Peregrinibacteria bacterium]
MIPLLPKAIAQKYGIDFAIAFGSQVSGQTHAESDLDLAVHSSKNPSLKEELHLLSELSAFYSKEVDLCWINENVSALLYGEWAKNSQLLYGNEEDYQVFCIEALKKFLDFEPYFKLQEQALQERLRQLS